MISSVFTAIVVGAIIGALGRLAVSGRQNISVLATILIGVVAALLGTLIAGLVGVSDTPGIDWIELVFQVALAAFGVALAAGRGLKVR
ncbi:MAG: GlsB/YeaQ/YmgE family stress response membrane protein [Dermatophilaceae bacterium]